MGRLAGFSSLLFSLLAVAPGAASPLKGAEVRTPKFLTSDSISPAGGWLVVAIEEHRPFKPPGARPGTSASQAIGQWIFRVGLVGSGAPQLLYGREGKDALEDADSYDTTAVLDDGTVLAIRETVLTKWDPGGRKTEKKLSEIGRGFPSFVAPRGKQALLAFTPLSDGEEPEESYFLLDPATLRLQKTPILRGLNRHELHWTADGKHLFGVVAVPRQPPRIKRPDGANIPNEDYRLVRVDLKSGAREPVSDRVWFDGICFGETTIVWNYQGDAKRGSFWRAGLAPPHAPAEVPALKDWIPTFALGKDRFLLSDFRSDRRRIVDLASFDEQKFASESRDLPFSKYGSILNYSRAAGLFVLEMRGDPFDLRLVDEEGNEKKAIRLERTPNRGKAAR